jgi:hypothetical protein
MKHNKFNDIVAGIIIVTIGILAVLNKFTDNHTIVKTDSNVLFHKITTDDKVLFFSPNNCPRCNIKD